MTAAVIERIGLAAVGKEVNVPFSRHPRDLDADAEAEQEVALGMVPPRNERQNERAAEAYAPPQGLPLPPYVQHRENTTRTGMLSAQAMVMEYERAAKEIDALGEELKAAVERTQSQIDLMTKAFASLQETATAYRAEAKRVFDQIEDCATMANDVADLCSKLRSKIEQTPQQQ